MIAASNSPAFLYAAEGAGKILQYGADGKVIWEYTADGKLLRDIKLSFAPFSVVRLDTGNTIICGEQTIVEVDPTDKIVWSIQGKDLPEVGIRWFAGI